MVIFVSLDDPFLTFRGHFKAFTLEVNVPLLFA